MKNSRYVDIFYSQSQCWWTNKWGEVECEIKGNKQGIRDAGSTADFRILFEIKKIGNLKIWKILEHLENFRAFVKVFKI